MMGVVSKPDLTSGRVLVVDDEAINRELLHDLLESEGHEVVEAEDGLSALTVVSDFCPHAILLDVMMPGVDGFEVCRRLKADPVTAPIPVLLVTALSDRDDRLHGIDAGATDFLTKPIDRRDVALRTRNAVRAKRLYDQVQDDLKKLHELESLRDSLTHMIVHDMRSPLTSIMGNLELLDMSLGYRLDGEDRICLEDARSASIQLLEMVSTLLDVSRLESGQMPVHRSSCELREVVGESAHLLAGLLRETPVEIDAPPGLKTECDRTLVQRVITNMLGNATRYTSPGTPIKVCIERLDRATRVSVRDQGPGIPEEYRTRIFEKFGQVEAGGAKKRYSTGLGLAFCKLAVEAHGGRIGVDSVLGSGSTFWFVLPDASAT